MLTAGFCNFSLSAESKAQELLNTVRPYTIEDHYTQHDPGYYTVEVIEAAAQKTKSEETKSLLSKIKAEEKLHLEGKSDKSIFNKLVQKKVEEATPAVKSDLKRRLTAAAMGSIEYRLLDRRMKNSYLHPSFLKNLPDHYSSFLKKIRPQFGQALGYDIKAGWKPGTRTGSPQAAIQNTIIPYLLIWLELTKGSGNPDRAELEEMITTSSGGLRELLTTIGAIPKEEIKNIENLEFKETEFDPMIDLLRVVSEN